VISGGDDASEDADDGKGKKRKGERKENEDTEKGKRQKPDMMQVALVSLPGPASNGGVEANGYPDVTIMSVVGGGVVLGKTSEASALAGPRY